MAEFYSHWDLRRNLVIKLILFLSGPETPFPLGVFTNAGLHHAIGQWWIWGPDGRMADAGPVTQAPNTRWWPPLYPVCSSLTAVLLLWCAYANLYSPNILCFYFLDQRYTFTQLLFSITWACIVWKSKAKIVPYIQYRANTWHLCYNSPQRKKNSQLVCLILKTFFFSDNPTALIDFLSVCSAIKNILCNYFGKLRLRRTRTHHPKLKSQCQGIEFQCGHTCSEYIRSQRS